MSFSVSKAVTQQVSFVIPNTQIETSVFIKRDDLIDPLVSGNKWRKLKYNIEQAKFKGCKGILTFGGSHSNHLVATAKVCQIEGLKAIGIVRGDELNPNSNQTLKDCAEFGMKLEFVSRAVYQNRNDWDYQMEMKSAHSEFYIIPEGGSNFYGVIGCQEIMHEVQGEYDHLFVSGGTGTTAAGIILSTAKSTKIHVVSALKGGFMKEAVVQKLRLVSDIDEESILDNVVFEDDYHFGGYGKVTLDLIHYITELNKNTGILFDQVYTGKTMYALTDLVKQNKIDIKEKVLFVHTGGIQGIRGIDGLA